MQRAQPQIGSDVSLVTIGLEACCARYELCFFLEQAKANTC